MSSPASAIERGAAGRMVTSGAAELIAASSLEISPRELHRAADVAALLPADSCVYIPSLPGLPLSRTLDAVAAIRAAGLDPVPHVAARRIADREAFEEFLTRAVADHGVHRILLLGGDEPAPRGPYRDSLQLLEEGVIARAGVREIGIAGYPEGHVRIAARDIEAALARKVALTREQGLGVYMVTQFSFAPARVVDYCAEMARAWPALPIYVGMAGPTDPVALARYAQRCGVSASFRALRNLGSGIARLVTHDDPGEHIAAITRYCGSRGACNVVGIHVYSFGGAIRTASWMKGLLERP
jgi:methylenetetrahydrofolate reductase (NADPH)